VETQSPAWLAAASVSPATEKLDDSAAFALPARADTPTDLLDGLFGNRPVQPHLQKYFRSGLTQIASISVTVSFRQKGRIARRHDRGAGDYARVLHLNFAREAVGAAGTRHSLRPL